MNIVDNLFLHSKELDKDLILGNSETASYPELWQQIQLTSAFLRATVGTEQKILLLSDNSRFFIVAYFAIMKSGNVVVPLNPTIETAKLAYIREKCGAQTCFVQAKYKPRIHLPDLHLIDEGTLATALTNDPHSNAETTRDLKNDFDEGRLAAIIFTSGSTALPKGVMLSHANLQANTESIIAYLGLTASDVMEVVLPFFYCYGLSLLHTHIKVGGALVLNNNFLLLSSVIDDLLTYRCTGFAGVPTHFQILLRRADAFTKTHFPHLRYVTQAGGKLADPFIREFLDAFAETQIYIMYGQTEATARLSYLPPESLPEKIGSIGKGIPGVSLQVLSVDERPIQPGEIGEVVAEGKNIMLGYFEDEVETQKVLRSGKLHTGDLATVDEDGYIYLVAREKEFLKVGGERISPKEIENVLVALPGVVDCSVVGIADEHLGEAVKALIVLNEQAQHKLSEAEIRTHCYKQLARNKIPKEIQFVAQIPMNATGKKTLAMLKQLA